MSRLSHIWQHAKCLNNIQFLIVFLDHRRLLKPVADIQGPMVMANKRGLMAMASKLEVEAKPLLQDFRGRQSQSLDQALVGDLAAQLGLVDLGLLEHPYLQDLSSLHLTHRVLSRLLFSLLQLVVISLFLVLLEFFFNHHFQDHLGYHVVATDQL